MKIKSRLLTGAGALVVAGGLVVATAGVALAAGPSFEPDAHATGTVTLTDSSGSVITGGSTTTQPIAAYAVGTSLGHPTGDTKATLYLCTPQQGVDPGSWTCTKISASTDYTAVPAGVALPSGEPFVTSAGTDKSIAQAIAAAGTNNTSSDPGIYQLRVVTSGSGQAAMVTDQYNRVDISVNTTTSTWTVNYPAGTDATTTTVTQSPASPQNSSTPVTKTFTATVTPATAATTTGPVGTVQFFQGSTQIGTTQLISGAEPAGGYTAAVSVPQPTPSTWAVTAKFTPYTSSTFVEASSTSTAISSVVTNTDVNGTNTALTVNQDGYAGDSVVSTANVTSTATGNAITPCTGTVSFLDGSTPLPGSPVTVATVGTNCQATDTTTFTTAASHSITATYNPPAGSTLETSTSTPPVTFSQTAKGLPCTTNPALGQTGSCTDTQNIQGTIPAGTLVISTPYDSGHPLDLGTLALSTDGTYFTGNATFGKGTAATDILITDTRAGDLPWTAQAQASALSDGGTNPGSTINGENVGLTNLTEVPVGGNGFNGTASNFTTFSNPAAAPPVAPGDPNLAGLGNAAHDIAQAKQGFGSIGLTGTLTLNAPSSTEAGLFKGTITFTVVGGLV